MLIKQKQDKLSEELSRLESISANAEEEEEERQKLECEKVRSPLHQRRPHTKIGGSRPPKLFYIVFEKSAF